MPENNLTEIELSCVEVRNSEEPLINNPIKLPEEVNIN
jgi:hypothetical protein